MSERTKKPTIDLVITAIAGYGWEQIRPFALSLLRSGFKGDKVILAANTDPFAIECLENRGIEVVQFPVSSPKGVYHFEFVVRGRYVPLLHFLAERKNEYRNVIWVDAGDQIFQSDPSAWFDAHTVPDTRFIVAARECWLIKDEMEFNDPWVKATVPEDYEWLRNMEVMCAGTIAGDAQTMFDLLSRMYLMVYDKTKNALVTEQAALNYFIHKPFSFPPTTHIYIPRMSEGWTATCSPFLGMMKRPESLLLDKAPIFDKTRGLVLTPDGKTPFTLVHQFNRDADWARIIHEKYRWD